MEDKDQPSFQMQYNNIKKKTKPLLLGSETYSWTSQS